MTVANIVRLPLNRRAIPDGADVSRAGAASAIGPSVDPLVQQLRHCLEVRDRLNAGDYEAEAEGEQLYARFSTMRRNIFGASSSTIEGAAARLFLVVDMLHAGVVYDDDEIASILRDAADHLGLPHSPEWRAKPELTLVAGGRA